MKFGGRPILTPAQQLLFLQRSEVFPGLGKLAGNKLTWRCDRRPTGLSRLYKVRLTYVGGATPDIMVDDPDLKLLAGGEKLPHVYSDRPTRLCLYLPGNKEWEPHQRFDHTVLPWTDLWLTYFEDWLARGCTDWQGGGEHPDDTENATRRERRRFESMYGRGRR
jgi:hypothetical protein